MKAILLIVICPMLCLSQEKGLLPEKFSPPLRQVFSNKTQESATFILVVKDIYLSKSWLGKNDNVKVLHVYEPANIILIKTTWQYLRENILPREDVLFIDVQRKAKEELAVSNLDLSANKSNVIHAKYQQWNGDGQTVSVKENRPDTADIDFHGRYLTTSLSSTIFSTHATNMATIIAGGGNTYYEGKGVAWGSTISSSSFAVLLPESDAAYQQYNISVQNHSYGTAIENYYGADASAYDASVINNPSLVHVFSAGNSGTQTSIMGNYASVPAFANITGSFKMAKNVIIVGHTDSIGNVLAASSRGPSNDGRVKPELVAFGEDGSSGAAAIVSGISLALQQAYKGMHASLPSAALVKAVLLNSADDVANKGIDLISGYGAANAYRAMLEIINGNHFNGNVANGITNSHDLVIPSNIKQVKITIAWNDPPAAPNAAKSLKNDLDLELLFSSGETWQPWVLSSFPNADSLRALPLRKRDSLNNVEQITLDNPLAGSYQLKVKGYMVTGNQAYSIAYQFDSLNKFSWFYPTKKDNLFGGRSNILRWESGYANSTAQLEYSLDSGSNWQNIDNAIDLSKGYYKWIPPDSFTTALLRISFGAQNFLTDTVTISKRFDLHVGFNCSDSFMLYWDKIAGINNYQLYQLGNTYMEPFLLTTDTAIVLAKQSHSSLHYAVAPVINNKSGVRSYAYNYTTQGVNCYIRTFLAQLIGKEAVLALQLGTSYNVKTITWQKLTLNGYIELKVITNVSGNDFNYSDTALIHGLNTYRVKIELQDGRVIYTSSETVYFAKESFIVYPNPAPRFHDVTIISNDPEISVLEIFNPMGVKVYEKKLTDWINTIPTGKLSKGIYFLRVRKDSEMSSTLRLVIY